MTTNNALDVACEIAADTGWDDDTLLLFATAFIEEQGLVEEFETFLRKKGDGEGEGEGEEEEG